jgi:hypothetical protein
VCSADGGGGSGGSSSSALFGAVFDITTIKKALFLPLFG